MPPPLPSSDLLAPPHLEARHLQHLVNPQSFNLSQIAGSQHFSDLLPPGVAFAVDPQNPLHPVLDSP
jgi:hypothetical protein